MSNRGAARNNSGGTRCTRNSSCRCSECTAAIQLSNMSEAIRPAPIDDIPLEEYAAFSRNSSNGKFGLTLLKTKIKGTNPPPRSINSSTRPNQPQSQTHLEQINQNNNQKRQTSGNMPQVNQNYQQSRPQQNQMNNQQPTRNIQSQSEVRSNYPKSSRDNAPVRNPNQNIPRQVESQPAFGNTRSYPESVDYEQSYSLPQTKGGQGGATCTRQSGCQCQDCRNALGTLSGRNTVQPTQNQMDLQDCPVCGRRFNSDVIDKHVQICEKNAHKKTKVFDMKKQRLQAAIEINGPDAAAILKQSNKPKPISNPTNTKPSANKQSKWRLQSEQLRRGMRQKVKTGNDGEDSPVYEPEPNDDYVQCPHCNRRFDPNVADRHIPKCADIVSKPTRLVRGQGMNRQMQINKSQNSQTNKKPTVPKKR